MLLLTAPTNYGCGVYITLQATGPVEGLLAAGVALAFGCPVQKAMSVASCIRAGGRYDFRTGIPRHALQGLVHGMAQIGVDVVIHKESAAPVSAPLVGQ